MPEMPTVIPFESGVTRLFGTCDLGANGLSQGWAVPEPAHIWNDGVEASMALSVDVPTGPGRLTFEGEPFLGASCVFQKVVLYANGFRLGAWQLREARTYTLSAPIEPEQIFSRGNRGLVRCVWHLPESVRPVDIGFGGDSRQLGFCFRSLTISTED